MKSIFSILVAVVLSVALSYVAFGRGGNGAVESKKETTWERVLRTNTIRCGYYVYPPVTYRDPNTNEMSGFSVDMMNLLAKRAGMKVEWVEEVSFGNWQLGLQGKRYDMACTPMWPNTAMGRVASFTKPLFYSAIYAIGRKGDDRFSGLNDLNRKDVTVSVQEGNDMLFLAEDVFPNTTIKANPIGADGNASALDVMSKKADFLLSDKNLIKQINATNPETLAILVQAPVKMMAFSLAVGSGQDELLQFINNAIDQMYVTGDIPRLLEKWAPDQDIYSHVAPGWQQ